MDALELIVDAGRPANAGRFFQLGADLLALLDELSDVPVPWRLTALRTGSALATIAPPETQPEDARWLRLVHSSLGRVGQGEPLPDEWTPDAVKAAHRFVEHGQPADSAEDWVAPRLALLTDTPRTPSNVELTAALSERLEVLQPFERTMPGSVRGELVGLNVSRGNRASLRLPNKRIVRVGFDTSLRGQLKDGLYKQVELSGAVRQDGDGRMFHIRADDVRVLVRPDMRWVDLFGIDPDYTEGASTEEWLGASRGEA